MTSTTGVTMAGALFAITFLAASPTAGAQTGTQPSRSVASVSVSQPAGQVRLIKAFVIDDRLSALRREPNLQSMVIRRIRLGQPVYLVSANSAKACQTKFCRVAVTRRTRGWIHSSALAVQGRGGEDQRIMALIEGSNDAVDRITLCRIIIERFSRSLLVPRAMLLLANEAERVATTLSQRTRRRLANLSESEATLRAGEATLRGGEASMRGSDASVRDYYLSDAGLDRYSRLGVAFDFNESTGEFAYDGRGYRELVMRFPAAEEARLARQRLEQASRNRSQTP